MHSPPVASIPKVRSGDVPYQDQENIKNDIPFTLSRDLKNESTSHEVKQRRDARQIMIMPNSKDFLEELSFSKPVFLTKAGLSPAGRRKEQNTKTQIKDEVLKCSVQFKTLLGQ